MKKSIKPSKKTLRKCLYLPPGFELVTKGDCLGYALLKRIVSYPKKRIYCGYLNYRKIRELIQLAPSGQREAILKFAERHAEKRKTKLEGGTKST